MTPCTFQDMILRLHTYWANEGCVILQPYDMQVGAGTFHWATTLRCLGGDDWKCAYVQPCRRPTDGRYGQNPNRLQHYYQYQVMLKPSPRESQDLYLASLQSIGIDVKKHDIRFVEDDWESPTLGASGLGWEVWIDGMEASQFTYFQQMGGYDCEPVSTELTYGLERLAMFVQDVDTVYDLKFNHTMSYGDVYRRAEIEHSTYNFEVANTDMLLQHFKDAENESARALERNLTHPAYEHCLNASHIFNVLDARGVISPTERESYIARVRDLAKACCTQYIENLAHTADVCDDTSVEQYRNHLQKKT